jgi:hypothetical protein
MSNEQIVHFAQAMQVGWYVAMAIALPFALPLVFRMARTLWAIGGIGTKVLGTLCVASFAGVTGILAGLALLGTYDHFHRTFPDAFGIAVSVGIGLAVFFVVIEFVAGAISDKQ